jgi:hypothetical protein
VALQPQIHARENATQRGSTSGALAGSISSTLKFLTKQALLGLADKFVSQEFDEAKGTSGSKWTIFSGRVSVVQSQPLLTIKGVMR